MSEVVTHEKHKLLCGKNYWASLCSEVSCHVIHRVLKQKVQIKCQKLKEDLCYYLSLIYLQLTSLWGGSVTLVGSTSGCLLPLPYLGGDMENARCRMFNVLLTHTLYGQIGCMPATSYPHNSPR